MAYFDRGVAKDVEHFHGWLRHVGDVLTNVFQWGFNQSMENHRDISSGID